MTLDSNVPPVGTSPCTTPVRGCVSSIAAGASCDSAIFPSNGQTFSRVRGRVIAYQKGTGEALHSAVIRRLGLDSYYVDGISLTYGAAGSRQHIWTFAASYYETDPDYDPRFNCACTNININWPDQSLHLLETITFVILPTLDQGLTKQKYIQKILYGMVMGVVPLIPAVSSTTPHGSAPHFLNLPQMTSS